MTNYTKYIYIYIDQALNFSLHHSIEIVLLKMTDVKSMTQKILVLKTKKKPAGQKQETLLFVLPVFVAGVLNLSQQTHQSPFIVTAPPAAH